MARQRLDELKVNPALLITGPELEKRLDALEEPEEVFEPDPPPTDDMLAQRVNRTLMSRIGQDTRAILIMEFIREEHMFDKLNIFLKKRLR